MDISSLKRITGERTYYKKLYKNRYDYCLGDGMVKDWTPYEILIEQGNQIQKTRFKN